MAEAHVDADMAGNVKWFKGKCPFPVLGSCPHECRHLGQRVIAWGPSLDRYELVECGPVGDDDGCKARCRAWVNGDGAVTTEWLHVKVEG